MAINQLRYSQEFERQTAKGKSFKDADAAAIKFAEPIKKVKPKKNLKFVADVLKKHKSTILEKTKPKPKKRVKESLVKKTARRLKELYYGPKTYLPKKELKTVRTKSTEAKLKTAGLTDKEIARLRGKK